MTLRYAIPVRHGMLLASVLISVSNAALHAQGVTIAPAVAPTVNGPVVNGLTISLDEALRRAEINQPEFAAAAADGKVAQLEKSIARASMLPSAMYHNQYLFTQGNGSNDRIGQTTTSPAPRFIANNAVHEYASQGVVNETVGLQQITAVILADANVAKAQAEFEIARRGLVATVVSLYYGLNAEEAKLVSARRAANEAEQFLTQTWQREAAREGAHADVVKAQLQQQQRARDVSDAQIGANKARLELGVLLFPDPRTEFQTEAAAAPGLPGRSEMEDAAARNNAELKSALASMRASEIGVSAARAAYLPDLVLNFTYGLDAPQFAANGPDGSRNLGYSASATIDIPVWDWLSTAHKVKQSEIRRDAAKVLLTATQRRLVAELGESYDEAAGARDQLASLDASVATAEESLRLTRLRYTGGEGSALEVVDAQNALISAEIAHADGMVRYRVALAALQTLTGRL
jgi:outer membrane protein TolC